MTITEWVHVCHLALMSLDDDWAACLADHAGGELEMHTSKYHPEDDEDDA